jgi:hypothetical protein
MIDTTFNKRLRLYAQLPPLVNKMARVLAPADADDRQPQRHLRAVSSGLVTTESKRLWCGAILTIGTHTHTCKQTSPC